MKCKHVSLALGLSPSTFTSPLLLTESRDNYPEVRMPGGRRITLLGLQKECTAKSGESVITFYFPWSYRLSCFAALLCQMARASQAA